jgi:hypothetical protein
LSARLAFLFAPAFARILAARAAALLLLRLAHDSIGLGFAALTFAARSSFSGLLTAAARLLELGVPGLSRSLSRLTPALLGLSDRDLLLREAVSNELPSVRRGDRIARAARPTRLVHVHTLHLSGMAPGTDVLVPFPDQRELVCGRP